MDDPSRKPEKANVFVRVRPFSEEEAQICPEDSPVPREIILWDGVRSLTVLDAVNDFCPRKNGQFDVDCVLWSFRDEEKPKVVLHTQQDVYSAVIAPMIPQIVSGYSTAFCVAGGPGGGRLYSLYGDNVDGVNRGLMPRFVENVFNAFKRERQDGCSLSCEIEAVDVLPSDTYVDLLAQKRKSGSAAAEELKVVQDPVYGAKLQGVTRAEAETSADAMKVLRQLWKVVSKRNSCHTVRFRFIETFKFDDPEEFQQSINKSRHVNVLFVLLRNMPAAFQRCVDVAVERDSGENPMAKVPTRETAFTKLYPDLLQQGYSLSFLCCVSPFFEHVRETMATLTLATKLMKLKCRPKLRQDQALNELRILSEEVMCLKSEVVKQTESTAIVQKELNAREVELMKREAIYHECEMKLLKQEEDILMAKHALNLGRYRTQYHRAQYNQQCENKRALVNSLNEKEKKAKKCEEEEKVALKDINRKITELERLLQDQNKTNGVYESSINERKKKEEKLSKMQKFIEATPRERRRIMEIEEEEARLMPPEELKTEELKQMEAAEARALARCLELEKEHARVYAASKPTRDKEELQSDIARLSKEIEGVEEEIRRLEAKKNKKSRGCQCVLM